jgi:PAS domain S-box-containing protein
MKKDIDDMAIFFRKHPFCFLINPDGIIFLSSKPEMVLKSFWPMDKTTQQKLIASQQFGNKLSGAVTKKEIVDGTEVTLEGKDYFVSRKVIDSGGWSIVLLTTTDRVWIYKLTGILTTIFVCFLIMVFSGILYLTDRSQKAIRQSEIFLSNIFDNSPFSQWISDERGTLIKQNHVCQELFHITDEEVVGKYNIFKDKIVERQGFMPCVSAVFERGEKANFIIKYNTVELRHLNPKQKVSLILEVTISPVKNEDGKVKNAIVQHMDITERKQAEDELRKSHKRLNDTIDFLPDATFVIDRDGKVITWNRAMELMTEISKEDMIGRGDYEYATPFYGQCRPILIDLTLLPDDVFEKNHYENIVRQGDTLHAESYVPQAYGGKGAFVWVTASRLRDASGNIIGAIESIRDITERKQTEELLKQSEEKYRLLADHMKDQVWIMNMDLKVTYISPSVEKLLGYTLNEFKYLPLDKILTSASFKATMDFISMEMPKALAAPSDYILTRSLEMEFCCKDGQTVWEESKFSFIRDDNRKPLSILVEARDITERKRAEEKLQESEERFRSMIQSLSDIIFILDGNGQLTYESPSATRILGYPPGYFIGKSPFIHIHPDDLDQVMKDLDEVFLLVNPGIPTEFRFQKADDTWIYSEALGNNQFENPSIQGIVLTVRDVTTRKQGEEKLQQTLDSLRKSVGATIQVMVSAVEMRDPYTAGHQIRTADLARAIATEMGLPKDKIDGIRMAGSIHDIGKISIPAEILSKPTKLTDIEFSLIKEHSYSGYEMLKDVESPWPLAQIVYQHHERMDGSGYPRNLKGDEILIEARIMAVADVVEAMASHRPYRPALGIEAALEEIEKNKGILYDNTVADTCLKLFREKGYQLT